MKLDDDGWFSLLELMKPNVEGDTDGHHESPPARSRLWQASEISKKAVPGKQTPTIWTFHGTQPRYNLGGLRRISLQNLRPWGDVSGAVAQNVDPSNETSLFSRQAVNQPLGLPCG